MSNRTRQSAIASAAPSALGCVCRNCEGTGVADDVVCMICNGARVITWEVFIETWNLAQDMARDKGIAEKAVKRLEARLHEATEKNADIDYVVEDYLDVLRRQLGTVRVS